MRQSLVSSLRNFHAAQRRRWASAIRCRPSGVLGPVLFPPWNLHRLRPGSDLARQDVPFRVLAPSNHKVRIRNPLQPNAQVCKFLLYERK